MGHPSLPRKGAGGETDPDWSGLADESRRIARLERENGFANKHRAAVVRARLRCVQLEQAIKWCRGRIGFLESGQWSTAI